MKLYNTWKKNWSLNRVLEGRVLILKNSMMQTREFMLKMKYPQQIMCFIQGQKPFCRVKKTDLEFYVLPWMYGNMLIYHDDH